MNSYVTNFKDNSTFPLFGEGYFNDKPYTYAYHIRNLSSFYAHIAKVGFPISLNITETKDEILFNNSNDFISWFVKHQSSDYDFGFSQLNNQELAENEIRSRINKLINQYHKILEDRSFQTKWNTNMVFISIEDLCCISRISVEVLKEKNIFPSKLDYTSIIEIFNTPFIEFNSDSLSEYSKKGEVIDFNVLEGLIKANLKFIERRIENIN